MLLLVVFMSIGTLVMGNLLRDFVLDSTANFDDRPGECSFLNVPQKLR